VRLDAVVGCQVCDLKSELQNIARAQDDGIWALLEGNSVQMSDFSIGWMKYESKLRTALNAVYPRQVQQRSTWVNEGRVGQHVRLR
jgi:hypothetical protein